MPGMPSTLSHCVTLPSARSTLDKPERLTWSAGIRQYSCTPGLPVTWSPTAKAALRDATTTPMPPARITSPMPTGGM